MKILVCGSRKWVEQASIEAALKRFPPGTTLIHGDCQGADRIAAYVGKRLGFIVRGYPATDKGRTWPSAGPLRNLDMLESEHPYEDGSYVDLGLVFHKDRSLGKGTKHMHGLLQLANPSIEIETYHK